MSHGSFQVQTEATRAVIKLKGPREKKLTFRRQGQASPPFDIHEVEVSAIRGSKSGAEELRWSRPHTPFASEAVGRRLPPKREQALTRVQWANRDSTPPLEGRFLQ